MQEQERLERRLNDHAERIRNLELRDAVQNEKIDALCQKLDKLSTRITDLMEFMQNLIWKGLGAMGAILLIFLSFFIWYVQKLGG